MSIDDDNEPTPHQTVLAALLGQTEARVGELGSIVGTLFERDELDAAAQPEPPIVTQNDAGPIFGTGAYTETPQQPRAAAANQATPTDDVPTTPTTAPRSPRNPICDSALGATLTRLISRNTPDATKQEFAWQPKAGKDNKDQFKDEVLAHSPKLKVFGMIQAGSPFLHAIHSLGRCVDFNAPATMRGKIIAFSGDRTQFGNPHPVVLPSVNTWAWKKVSFADDAVGCAAFYSDPTNKHEGWKPTALLAEMDLPRIVYLPPQVAFFCTEAQRTFWEIHQFMDGLVTEGAITEEDGEFLRCWMRAATQGDPTRPALGLELMPAVNANRNFAEWCCHHLDSFLGKNTPPSSHTAGNQGADVVAAIQNLATQWQSATASSHTQQSTIVSAAAKENHTPKPYSTYDIAAIKGYCGITATSDIPIIWALFKTSKDREDHRLNIQKRMAVWSKENGIPIDHSIFLASDTIDDIVKLRPNPGGASATVKTGERGVSILACLPRVASDIESIRLRESAAEASKGSRTLKEAERLAAADSREPATDFLSLKLNIATYASLLWALFANECSLYKRLMEVHDILDQPEVMLNKHAFSALLCKQITWAIYNDARTFFNVRLHPDDFKPTGKRIRWPTSLLADIHGDVMFQRPILRSNFPPTWLPPVVPSPYHRAPQPPGGANPFFPTGTITPRAERAGFTQHSNNSPPRDLTQGGASLTHIHPTIKAALTDYHAKFGGRAMIFRLLTAANLKMADLPKVSHLIDPTTGRNNLCYNHLLGVCPYGLQCNFAKHGGHLEARDVQADFATSLVATLQPGITWMLTNGPPPVRQDYAGGRGGGRGGGRPSKRPRTP
jgi:hypothetical protein